MASVASTTPSSGSSAYVDLGLESQPGSNTPDSSLAQHSVLLAFRDLRHFLSVPQTYERLLQGFANQFTAHLESLQDHALPCSDAGLVAAFLEFLATSPRIHQGSETLECVTLVLECFEEDFLAIESIHTLALRLPGSNEQRRGMLNAIRIAKSTTHAVHGRARQPSALFADAARTKVFAIFGGPSDVTAMLESLRRLCDVYDDIVASLVRIASDTLTSCLTSSEPWVQKRYRKGLDIAAWLTQPESMPSPRLLQSAPVALPIGGLFQVVNFAVACYELGLSPQELLQRLGGISGYSAGIVAATVLATTSDLASLDHAVSQAVQILFELGSAAEELCQTSPSDIAPAIAMLRVIDCPQAELEKQISTLNKPLETSLHVHSAVRNGPQDVTVAGPNQSIKALYTRLNGLRAPSHLDQSKTPANLRKPSIELHEVPISVPLHTSHLREIFPFASGRLQGIKIPTSSLGVAVFDSRTGLDMRNLAQDDLLPTLLQIVMSDTNDWEASTRFDKATHVLDFGPGGANGAGAILHRSSDGTGLRVILASVDEDASPWFGTRFDLFAQEVATNPDWSLTYAPALRKSHNGQLVLDNKMTRLLGVPPVMVAGMTPTTASWELVSAITNAGYHAELAGGGFINKEDFDVAIQKLADSTPRGRGICINLIYGNPRQFRWQVLQIKKLLAEGFPIDGVTFGAGVPSLDALQEFFDMNLKYLCFKPGSTASIDQVVEIANAVKTFPIVLQWTGGRAGGHHSYEDFHAPIVKCYARIRACPNIVLVAGSGFGGSDDSYQYLSGEWSLRFQRARMPFDGILLGSRVMVAKEAKTSRAVKNVIVATPGLPNDEAWWQSYHAPAGGVVTVKSEMGEPIHKIATRGTLLWKELDQTVFGITDPAKRLAKLVEIKSELIGRLNRDFQKVWFGQNSRGDPIDTEDMTYGEVLQRLIDLLYIREEQRWIHASHEKLVRDFVNRIYCRVRTPLTLIETPLADPLNALALLLKNMEDLRDEVLATRDSLYFIMLCKRTGQKPPPFLVDMGSDFETWFKKDSLWQSEDMAAVIDQDPGRICILQGPVAARHSTQVDEPVQSILDGISTTYVESVLQDRYEGDAASVPVMKYSPSWTPTDLPDIFTSRNDGQDGCFQMTGDMTIADREAMLEAIAGPPGTWLYAMVMSDQVSQGRRTTPNPIRRILSASSNFHIVQAQTDKAQDMQLIIHEGDPDDSDPRQNKQSLSLSFDRESIQVVFETNENQARKPLALTFEFSHHPETPLHPIWEECLATRNVRMAEFYRRVWLEESSDKATQLRKQVREYIDSIQEDGYGDAHRGSGISCNRILPDFGMVLAWRSLLDAVLHPDIYGPCLDLVHLSNEFELLDSRCMSEQDLAALTSKIEILAVCDEPIGRLVRAKAILTTGEVPIAHLVVEFLFRNYHEHAKVLFETIQEPQMAISVASRTESVLLRARPWIVWDTPDANLMGKKLTFDLATIKNFGSHSTVGRTQTTGTIVDESGVKVGKVHLVKQGTSSNAVNDYLSRHGKRVAERHALRTPQQMDTHEVTLPSSNVNYSRASGDFNPIHTSSIFASYASLPGTITHGMYVSAAVRTKVEKAAGCSEAVRMRFYKVSFIGMALPNTVLEVRVTHTEMQQGLRVLVFEARNKETKEMVVAGEARVDQASTAYVFTGQGSQKKGMGMDLRASCPIARGVWDKADAYYSESYGFLISEIVDRNAKQLTIHFGGRRGKAIRENYMAMLTATPNGHEAVFPSINASTTSYTFRNEAGLLFSTEFSQPALTVVERAQFEHVRSRGLVVEGALYAGHSLGEYSALGNLGQAIPFEELLSLTFYRALIMNSAVPRDSQGRSGYGMMAVNPSRIGKHVDTTLLEHLVALIASATGGLLQIVNYNIATQQYVASGCLASLACLSTTADALATRSSEYRVTNGEIQGLRELVAASVATTPTPTKASLLKRGIATTPLEGIDVPFHSSSLLPKMPAFREMLHRHLPKGTVDASRLVGRFVTNVTGNTFDISRAGVQDIFDRTQSVVLQALLDDKDFK